MLGQQTTMTSHAMLIQSELRQGHCPLVAGWLTPWTLITSFDPRARQTDVRPSQRAVCPLQDSLACVSTFLAIVFVPIIDIGQMLTLQRVCLLASFVQGTKCFTCILFIVEMHAKLPVMTIPIFSFSPGMLKGVGPESETCFLGVLCL